MRLELLTLFFIPFLFVSCNKNEVVPTDFIKIDGKQISLKNANFYVYIDEGPSEATHSVRWFYLTDKDKDDPESQMTYHIQIDLTYPIETGFISTQYPLIAKYLEPDDFCSDIHIDFYSELGCSGNATFSSCHLDKDDEKDTEYYIQTGNIRSPIFNSPPA